MSNKHEKNRAQLVFDQSGSRTAVAISKKVKKLLDLPIYQDLLQNEMASSLGHASPLHNSFCIILLKDKQIYEC